MKIITTVISGLMLFFAISSGHANIIVWTNTTSGNWTDSINWSPNQIPGSSDTAVITNSGTYTITLDVDAEVGGLILGSTNGTGTQTISINFRNFSLNGQAMVYSSGQFDLSSGTFSGGVGGGVMVGDWVFSGAALSGTLTLASNSVMNLTANIDFFQTVLTNYGTVNWEAGTLSGHNSPWFYNYGLWDAQANNLFYNDSGYYYDQVATFNNYGMFRKSGGTGDGSGGASTSLNQGLIFNNAGTLDVQSGTVMVGSGVGSGTFDTATNARTYLSVYTLTGDPVFAGEGTVDGSLMGSNVVLHGTINLNQSGFQGTLTIASNAVLNLLANIDFFQTVLTNYGTVNWEAGTLSGHNSPWFYNYGLWDAQANNLFYNDSGYYNDQRAAFNNYGTLRKSGGTGDGSNYADTYLDQTLSFTNIGTLDVQSGTMSVSSGAGSGVFDTATNARTYLAYFTLTGDPVFAGEGTVDGSLVGSNVVLHGTINLNQSGFQGTLTIASNAVLNLLANMTFFQTVLTNYGTVNWNAGQLLGQYSPRFYNYGLWDAKANNQFDNDSGYYNDQMATFNNYGTFRKSGGTGGSSTYLGQTLSFNNTGTLDVQTGVLEMGGNYAQAGGTMIFDISSLTDFGSMFLANNAALDCTLTVNLTNNYSPVDGNAFTLLAYGLATGTFTALNLPHLSGALIWQTNFADHTFSLSVTTAPPFQLTGVIASPGSGEFSFNFGAIVNQSYQVQWATNLAPAVWFNLGPSVTATNTTMPVTDFLDENPQRFYRVILQ